MTGASPAAQLVGMNPDQVPAGVHCASTSTETLKVGGAGSRTHLASPAMVAAAAINGHFVDIRKAGVA